MYIKQGFLDLVVSFMRCLPDCHPRPIARDISCRTLLLTMWTLL